jgi:hypothetical protein
VQDAHGPYVAHTKEAPSTPSVFGVGEPPFAEGFAAAHPGPNDRDALFSGIADRVGFDDPSPDDSGSYGLIVDGHGVPISDSLFDFVHVKKKGALFSFQMF